AELVLNIGRGEGASVAEMVDLILDVTGRTGLPPVSESRRPGDPARVVASVDAIAAELDWSARYGMRTMVESAWAG
ncbi:UDP-glucose 4-epimerase GalE, partial [Streptomyces sp. SID7982]|nr:UDP-glucose 4-epimerase GalE [Streptomyces sp. SID7982]